MRQTTIDMLGQYGPDRCGTMSPEQAVAWCRKLALGHYENFSVLSSLVPSELRDHFAAVYAFCRWADDLGDEVGDANHAAELLQWWRSELNLCFEDQPRHPVFVALRPTITRFDLPIKPFDDLIRAFEQDQHTTRYATWAQLIDYCNHSADPVGRIVLMLFEQPRDEAMLAHSDQLCTALQLTNHLQDVRRDVVDRDRIYLPSELFPDDTFEQRLAASAKQRYAVDHTLLEQSRRIIRTCANRTWELYEQGQKLFDELNDRARPVVRLLVSGGVHVLRQVELWNYETALHRPKLGKVARLRLLGSAWMAAKRRGAAPYRKGAAA